MSSRLTGHEARKIRMTLEDNDSTEFNELIKEELEDLLTNVTLDSISIENYDNIHEPLKYSSKVEFPGPNIQGNRLLLEPFEYFTNADNSFFAQEREKAILFQNSYQLRESAQFQIPEGWQIEALQGDTMFVNLVGECSVQFTDFGNTLSVQRFFTLSSPFWRVDQYPVVKKLSQTRQDLNDLTIVLVRTE